MKKAAIVCICTLVAVFCLAAVAKNAGAWFDSSKLTNAKLTAGTVNTDIVETFDPPADWKPGTDVPKIIQIKNLGNTGAYVRVKLICTWQEKLNDVWADTSLDIGNVTLTQDSSSTGWIYSNDFYYCKSILNPGSLSDPLKMNITLNSSTTDYENKRFKVRVYSESVQSSHDAYKTSWGIADLPEGVAR